MSGLWPESFFLVLAIRVVPVGSASFQSSVGLKAVDGLRVSAVAVLDISAPATGVCKVVGTVTRNTLDCILYVVAWLKLCMVSI